MLKLKRSSGRSLWIHLFTFMINKKFKYLFGVLFAVLIGYILYDSFSQPTTNDLEGNFKEVALYRNENNTGPVVRIYAVTAEGLPWREMEKYGSMMPYTKMGSTTVYFFDQNRPAPTVVNPGNPHFEARYESSCIAMYQKDASGQVNFTRNPFQK